MAEQGKTMTFLSLLCTYKPQNLAILREYTSLSSNRHTSYCHSYEGRNPFLKQSPSPCLRDRFWPA